jgi:hypothetical protein
MAQTEIDLATAPTAEVAARLQVQGLDLDRQGGVLILRDFGGGSLLEWPVIREHLTQGDDGWVYVRWGQLGGAVAAEDERLVYLSSSARGALDLAVALATGRPVADLGQVLCRFDSGNAAAVSQALSYPLRQQRGPLRERAEWLVSLDEDRPPTETWVMMLDEVITRAREALGRTKEG